MKLFSLLIYTIIALAATTTPTITTTKSSIIKNNNLFQDFFLHTLHNTNKTNKIAYIDVIKEYQLNTIKYRNYECLFREYKLFDKFEINFKDVNKTYLDDLWNNYLENYNSTLLIDYLNGTCFDIEHFAKLKLFNSNKTIIDLNNDEEFEDSLDTLIQFILIQSVNNGCDFCHGVELPQPSQNYQIWLYGFSFVTIINLSSLVGAIVIPCTNKEFYKKILMFLIALAIGSLAGSGFIHLIPQAHGISEDPYYALNHEYVWKGLVIMGGAYLFYLVERVMKILISLRKNRLKSKSLRKSNNQSTTMFDNLEHLGYVKPKDQPVDLAVEMRTQILEQACHEEMDQLSNGNNNHGHSHFNVGKEDLTLVAPVAWMIIFGDGLHNFIDGLSIGAGLTESIFKGISICIAVICEEFPHELGDFAILINAGMTYKQALLFNGLSACCCYLGLIIGVFLGVSLQINQWIYGLAGGMFLYIALCDMVPELNETSNELEEAYLKKLKKNNDLLEQQINVESAITFYKFKLLFIQNVGIIIGFTVMFIMARFGKHIEIKS